MCRLERSTPEGSVTYVLDKSGCRSGWCLRTAKNESRRKEYAKEHGFQVVVTKKKSPKIGVFTGKLTGLHPMF